MPRLLTEQLVAHGERPCATCRKPHKAYAVDGEPDLWGSWADPDDGHPYWPVSWEVVARLLAEQTKVPLTEWELPERDEAGELPDLLYG